MPYTNVPMGEKKVTEMKRTVKYKKAVRLFLEGMTNKEIGKEMGVSGAAVGQWGKTKEWQDELKRQSELHPLYEKNAYMSEIDAINDNFKKLVNTRFFTLANLEALLAEASKEVLKASKEVDVKTGKNDPLKAVHLAKKIGINDLAKSLATLSDGLINYLESVYQVGSVSEYVRRKAMEYDEETIFNARP